MEAGIYDVDCSAFLGFLIGAVAERHYEMIAGSTTHKRPLARDFYRFFAALPTTIEGGWRRVTRLDDIVPGDVMAWELPEAQTGDTGHCFVVAARPVDADDGGRSVRVYDSTSILHFEDTREPDGSGIGSGSIHFEIDAEGAPTAFRFDANVRHFKPMPIAIARIEPFSAA